MGGGKSQTKGSKSNWNGNLSIGWLKMARSLRSMNGYFGEPFSKVHSLMDLMLQTVYTPQVVQFNGKSVCLSEFQLVTSIRRLSSEWKRTDKTVREWLREFEENGFISTKIDSKTGTVITVSIDAINRSTTTPNEPESRCNDSVSEDLKISTTTLGAFTTTPSTTPNEPESRCGATVSEVFEKSSTTPTTTHSLRKERRSISSSMSVEEGAFVRQVIDYLNERTGRSNERRKFSSETKSHRKNILARFHEGYVFEDFQAVIDSKCAEWMGTEREKYLTPSTLFIDAHFNDYLCTADIPKQKPERQGIKFKN